MGQDEDLRREIVEHEGRKLLDFTLQTAWAQNPASKLELEGARRRLLVESMRVSKAAEAEDEDEESEVNVEDLYTQEQLDDMRVAFETFDLDGSGDIDSDELGLVMKKLGLNPTEAEIEDMIRAADNGEGEGGGDGKIDWQEFLALMARGMGKDNEDEYQRAYNFFDQDHRGYIDVVEFIEKLRQLTSDFSDEEVDLMIINAKFEDELFDRLTYKEFVKLMMAE
jgi:calmodulin